MSESEASGFRLWPLHGDRHGQGKTTLFSESNNQHEFLRYKLSVYSRNPQKSAKIRNTSAAHKHVSNPDPTDRKPATKNLCRSVGNSINSNILTAVRLRFRPNLLGK